ncbi:MAG TPA: sigma-70 family RNA polymerase sigma factor [Kofleriaceae bacterium]|jgi:RNA polymerase sigma-70 factor (ECF subfamily)
MMPIRDAISGESMPDETRLSALYREFGPVIYARCRRLLRDPAAAEDATQETFIRVHRHLAKAEERDALTWIFRIATNLCLNEIRNRKQRPELWDVLPDTASADIGAALADRDQAARIIARLPEKLAAIAWLYHVDGLDQAEVARVLDISRRTVVTRLGELEEAARRALTRGNV